MSQTFEAALAQALAQALGDVVGEQGDVVAELRSLRRELAGDRVVPPVMTAPQAAEYMGVSRRTLDHLTSQGVVRVAKLGGSVRFRREWLDEALERAAVGGVTRVGTILAMEG